METSCDRLRGRDDTSKDFFSQGRRKPRQRRRGQLLCRLRLRVGRFGDGVLVEHHQNVELFVVELGRALADVEVGRLELRRRGQEGAQEELFPAEQEFR